MLYNPINLILISNKLTKPNLILTSNKLTEANYADWEKKI